MGLIAVSERTSARRAARIRARLMNARKAESSDLVKPLVDVDLIKRIAALEEATGLIENQSPPMYWTAASIIKEMSAAMGFAPLEIKSPRREVRLALARHKMMWVVKNTTKMTLPMIGRSFGGRDHTTVLHAVRRIDKLIAANDPRVSDLKQWVTE